MEDNICLAKFTVLCAGKKIEKLRLTGNIDAKEVAFSQGIEMNQIDNGDKWTIQNSLTFPLNSNLEFILEVLNNAGDLVESELEAGQKHKIQLTEPTMELQWTFGFEYVENEIDWDKIIDEQERAFNETKEKSEKLIEELKEKNEEQAKQMDELAQNMQQQQDMIGELNQSIQDYTKKVQELAEQNNKQMVEFEQQKEKYLLEMQQFEEQQKIALENLKLSDCEEPKEQQLQEKEK